VGRWDCGCAPPADLRVNSVAPHGEGDTKMGNGLNPRSKYQASPPMLRAMRICSTAQSARSVRADALQARLRLYRDAR
jgi:hypothetical protein